MHTLGLALALVGLNTAWIPGFGWIGVGLCLAGCVFGLRSVSDRESRTLATILGTCALFFGGFGLLFGLGVQIKHGAPALDGLLLPLPWSLAALGAAFALALLFGAVLLARFKARRVGLAVAVVLFAVLVVSGSSALVAADRDIAAAAGAADRVDRPSIFAFPDPSPRKGVHPVHPVHSVH